MPLPRRGVLSGKSPCTGRRWRLFFVQLQLLDFAKIGLSPRLRTMDQLQDGMRFSVHSAIGWQQMTHLRGLPVRWDQMHHL